MIRPPRILGSSRKAAVASLAANPAGDHLAVCHRERSAEAPQVIVWSLDREEPVATLTCLEAPRFEPSAVAFLADGRRLCLSGYNDGLRIWDPAQDEIRILVEPGTDDKIAWMRHAAERDLLVTCGSRVALWRPSDGTEVRQLDVTVSSDVFMRHPRAVLDPAGRRLAIANVEPGRVLVFDTDSGRVLDTLDGPEHATHATWSPDGKWLLFTGLGYDSGNFLWDGETLERRSPEGFEGERRSLGAVEIGSEVLASYGPRGSLGLRWPAPTFPRAFAEWIHDGGVADVAFPRGRGVVATGGLDGTIQLWNLADLLDRPERATGDALPGGPSGARRPGGKAGELLDAVERGALSRRRLYLAAYAGDRAAQTASGGTFPAHWARDPKAWVEPLWAAGGAVLLRAALALGREALRDLEPTHPDAAPHEDRDGASRALAAAAAFLDDPVPAAVPPCREAVGQIFPSLPAKLCQAAPKVALWLGHLLAIGRLADLETRLPKTLNRDGIPDEIFDKPFADSPQRMLAAIVEEGAKVLGKARVRKAMREELAQWALGEI